MTFVAHNSRPQGPYNEDFSFHHHFESSGRHILVVGDFARSNFTGLDKLATMLLEQSLNQSLAFIPMPSLLAHLASQLNNALLNQKQAWNMNFQCCAVFAGISGTILHYVSIGDCRIAVRRKQNLLLLNGTLWVDPSGNLLPPVVAANQDMQRGAEPPPAQALGIRQEFIPPSLVQWFPLERDDQVLLYSDGVDKVLSPRDLLALISNNQHASAAVDGALDEIVTQVLNEVELNRADDDRSFLIASGPHVAVESEEFVAERAHLDNAQEQLANRIAAIEEEMKDIKTNLVSLSELIEYAKSNEAAMNGVQTELQSLATTVGEHLKEINADLVNAISDQVQLLRDVLALRTANDSAGSQSTDASPGQTAPLGSATLAPPPPPAPPVDDAQQKRASHEPVSEVAVAAAATSTDPRDFVKVVKEIDQPQKYKDEGKIYLQDGVLVLRNLNEAVPEALGKPNPSYFIVVEKNAPDGWLTALFLFLKQTDHPPFISSDIPDIVEYIQKKTPELAKVHEAHPSLFQNLRDQHKKLKRNSRKFKGAEGNLAASLRNHMNLQSEEEGASPPPDLEKQSTGPKTEWWSLLRQNLDVFYRSKAFPAVGTLVVILLMAVVVIFLYRASQPEPHESTTNTQNRNAAAPTKQVQLRFAGDGRRVILIDQGNRTRLNLCVQLGKEDDLSNLMEDEKFTSRTEAEDWLNSERIKRLLAGPCTQLQAPRGTQFFPLEQGDFQTRDDVCNSFLKRVNSKLPGGVRTEYAQLNVLNHGLYCPDLQEGDELLVYVVKR